MTKTYRLVRASAVLVMVAAVTACGGGTGSPGVASLKGSGGSTTTLAAATPGGQSATQLFDQWAQCVRQHGLPGMADPVINAQGQVNIALPPGSTIQIYEAADTVCKAQHRAATAAARAGQPAPQKDPARLLSYSTCMRAHGLADFPDPGPNGSLKMAGAPGTDLDPASPTFIAAQQACQSIIGALSGAERIIGTGGSGG